MIKMLNFVGGQWVPASGRQTLAEIGPATGRESDRSPRFNAEDVPSTVEVASQAASHGRRVSAEERGELLEKIPNAISRKF